MKQNATGFNIIFCFFFAQTLLQINNTKCTVVGTFIILEFPNSCIKYSDILLHLKKRIFFVPRAAVPCITVPYITIPCTVLPSLRRGRERRWLAALAATAARPCCPYSYIVFNSNDSLIVNDSSELRRELREDLHISKFT